MRSFPVLFIDNVDSELKEIFVSALLFSKYNLQIVDNVQYQILTFLESATFICMFPCLILLFKVIALFDLEITLNQIFLFMDLF